MKRRLPAEWEEQDGVLLAWPHKDSDWHPVLHEVEPVFVEIAKQISLYEQVVIIAPDRNVLKEKLRHAGAIMERVTICEIGSNDTWMRDFGPITVLEDEKPLLLDFFFNGWGLKFAADQDNQATRRLHQAGVFAKTALKTVGLVLEGGSIESDGKGTLLTTEECLLGPNRNPHLSREEIEATLAETLGTEKVLWLGSGFLAGDDTDSHIDTLARLCPENTLLYVSCPDEKDLHFTALQQMAVELESFRTSDGSPFRLIPLPWPSPRYDEDGQRLPATYANFLVINGAVLVPTYLDKNDTAALAAIREAFPGRAVIGIDCLPLIEQHGSLHCLTMQIPKGVLP
ncbi:MAG: agmatine deiminase family protein [Geobacter sp.]|nr:MAG: agmatine deiminase family protein [Geobacter sp.]